ncbi:TIGR04211 family SH3 domain-containing protein [Candidatus Thiosymbion oneisti]|uniref:TIGR04211 family SH3 domain-containing protein n=1 Tax=Candidatus Thiosymbion oneisti TaxID=589554 RepID=UPI000AC88758|nr:TIGR04211 family SH3 domain-containing protein [Candidatus Thiosymbion oneisti]
MTRFLLLLLCLCGLGQALAETRYITDIAQIELRKGESTRYKILRYLTSGEAVEELGTNKRTGYSRIRTRDGTTGYVLTRQLQDEPGARDRLVAMEARLAEFQQAPDQLAVKLSELRSAHQKLKADHEALGQEKEQLEEELASIKYASTNLVAITQERSDLRKSVADLTGQVADLRQKNRDLKNETNQRWFLIGAGVVIGAILIGLILPYIRFRRRKTDWGTL